MDFESTLKEYQAFPKNAELVEKLLVLQDETMKAGDADAFLKTTTLLTDSYLLLQETDEAVAMLTAVLRDNAFEDYRTIVTIVDRLVALLLKTEDFPQLEQVLAYRARFVAGVPSQVMMQQFYLSVCYEGLKKYDLAIDALLAVTDNASNANVAAKYLKLAMLYLRTHDLDAARNAYDHALIFDKVKKNEMFHLVESDILFAEGRILNALKAYQDFFLKSKTKTRYLDRYITINARLGNYEEAWRFYKEYERKASTNVSKIYRLELYEAGLLVAETLRKYDEVASIKEKILQLSEKEAEVVDSFDGIRALLEASNRISVESDRRDVVLETFRALHRIIELSHCMFVAPAPEGVLIENYSKGLLIDKTFAAADLAGTAAGFVIEADRDYLLLTRNEFAEIVDHVENRPLKDEPHQAVLGYRVRTGGTTAGFMIAYLDRDRHFDFASKLLVTARIVLEGRFDVARLRTADAARLKTADAVFSATGSGMFRIESGYLFLLDERAKKLLETERGFIPFEEFQTRMGDKPLYVDDFVARKALDFKVVGFAGKAMLWHADIRIEDAAVHFAARDILGETEKAAEATRRADASYGLGLGSMHALDAAFADMKTQCSLAVWRVTALLSADHLTWLAGMRILAESIRSASGPHLKSIHQGDDGAIIVLYGTIDKRVLDRIAGDAIETADRSIAAAIPHLVVPSTRAGFANVLRNFTLEETLGKAGSALLDTDDSRPVRYYDRDLMQRENQLQAVAGHLEALIAENGLKPRYTQIGNLFTKKVEMYRVALHPDPVIGDIGLLRAAIAARGLSTSVSRALFQTAIRDAETLERDHGLSVRFAFPLHPSSLLVPGFVDEIVRSAKRRRIPPARIVFIVMPEGVVTPKAASEPIQRLSTLGYAFAYDGRRTETRPWTDKVPFEWDYVWIDPEDLVSSERVFWEAYASTTKTALVAAPVNEESVAVQVRNAKIAFVEGAILPSFDTVEEIAAVVR
jgi:tetratricopeptide (TPR) repeat protein